MAKTATLSIDITADATAATRAFNDAGDAAGRTAANVKDVGEKSGDTASGLSAIAGALDAAGFGPAADALGLFATGLDATEGSARLFKVAQETLTLTTLKDTAARIANSVATTAASAATKAWAAVQWLLNAAMTANPIGAIIALVLLLIGAVVLIATKTTWFQDAWSAAWGAIKAAASAVFDWLKAAGPVALEGLLWPIKQVQKAFDAVVDAIKSVIDWLKKIKLPDALSAVGDFVGGIFGRSTTPAAGAPAPGLSSRAVTRAAGAGTTTVQVFVPEASDPVATARYLKALIRRGQAAGVMFGTP